MSKIGPKETALREQREQKVKKPAKPCTIDHLAEGAIPKSLCRKCNDIPAAAPKNGVIIGYASSASPLAVDKTRRDWRIPKGMSDEDGKAMLARREQEKKDKAAKRIADMLEKKKEKEIETIARANKARAEKGLPEISQPQQKESVMRTKSKSKSTANARKPAEKKTKLELIAELLKRKEGCTTADILKLTGWPSVSVPATAKAAGLKLKKEKDGSVTRYRAA